MEGGMVLRALLASFGASIGVELEPDEDGYACLSIDEEFVVHLHYDEATESLRLFSELCKPSPGSEQRVMQALLDANVLWRGSNGGTLGFDSETKAVTLAFCESIARLSPVRFEQLLEAFVLTGETWIAKVGGIGRDDSTDLHAASASQLEGMDADRRDGGVLCQLV